MNDVKFERERVLYGLKVTLPAPPPIEQIMNYDLPKEDQRWVPKGLPPIKEFNSLTRAQQVELIKPEYKRRREGFWFFNNGNLEYITGIHYFYLTYWHLPEGLPRWTDADRDFFYFWDECVRDPLCYGMIDVENRRGGKTSKANVIGFEKISRTKNVNGGIQSKTEKDGRTVFGKLKRSWQKLHPAWKPIDSGDTNPARELRFEEPSKRSTKGAEKVYREVLNSMIDFRAATEVAYDGDALAFLFNDEFGKTTEVNVYDRWDVQKYCLVNPYAKPSIVGKALFTTTVEEMEKKGGKNAKKLWDESDHTKKEVTGQTKSGLYRYFKPAYYGHADYMDEYGYSLVDKAKAALIEERETKSGESLYSLIRKQPFSAEEAFLIPGKNDTFPAHKIHEQMMYNELHKGPQYRKGNFLWINDEKTQVEFFDDPNGRWKVAWILKDDLKNNNHIYRGKLTPGNTSLGLLAIDPFDHKTTVDDRKSNASMHLYRGFDANESLRSGCWVMEYIGRPPIPEMLYEDAAMTCVYYGMEILPENQKPGIINWFNSNGFGNFIRKTFLADTTSNSSNKKVIEGVSTSGEYIREQMVNAVLTQCYENFGKLSPEHLAKRGIHHDGNYYGFHPFQDSLQQLLDFDIFHWTKYDAFISMSLSLIGFKGIRSKNIVKQERPDLDEFFPYVNQR